MKIRKTLLLSCLVITFALFGAETALAHGDEPHDQKSGEVALTKEQALAVLKKGVVTMESTISGENLKQIFNDGPMMQTWHSTDAMMRNAVEVLNHYAADLDELKKRRVQGALRYLSKSLNDFNIATHSRDTKKSITAVDRAKKAMHLLMTRMGMAIPHRLEAHWSAPTVAAGRQNPIPSTTVSIYRGKNLFQANCVSCHGTSARGDGPLAKALTPKPADLVAMAPTHPDGGLAWKIAEGRGAMPGWKQSLSEKEIWNVVNFLKSLSKDKSKSQPMAHHDHHQRQHQH